MIPDYTKRAIAKYNSKFDAVSVKLPKGTAERIRQETGQSVNAFINKLVADALGDAGADQPEKFQN